MLDADVIVVGAGPVGLSLAVDLAMRRRKVLVLEQLPALNEEERASTFHPPSLELLDRWGVLADVVERGRVIDRLQYWERDSRDLVAEFPYTLISADTNCPFRLQCPQSVVTPLLREKLLEQGGILNLDQRVTGVIDRGDHADVATANTDGLLRARYVIGTDGAGSSVRKSLGIRLRGRTYADRFLLVGADIELAELYPGIGPVAYIFDPREWVIVMHLPDRVRLVFRIEHHEDEADVQSAASVRERVSRFLGRDTDFDIKSISVYGVHQRVADRFRQGAVLLAGDAAHVNNPVGGYGMNAGIQDAAALSAAVDTALATGTDTTLAEYATVRHQVAASQVNAAADLNYQELTAVEDRARVERNRSLRQAAADPAAARRWLLRASMLQPPAAGGH